MLTHADTATSHSIRNAADDGLIAVITHLKAVLLKAARLQTPAEVNQTIRAATTLARTCMHVRTSRAPAPAAPSQADAVSPAPSMAPAQPAAEPPDLAATSTPGLEATAALGTLMPYLLDLQLDPRAADFALSAAGRLDARAGTTSSG